jgi:lipoprotein signal peptidase
MARLRGDQRPDLNGGRRSTDREPNRGWIPAIVIVLAIACSDWLAKAFIIQTMPFRSFREVWEGRVAFWHMRNDAMILGLYGDLPLQSRQAIAVMAAVLATLLLFEVVTRGHRLPPGRRNWVWLFVGLASGGMLGNLGERALHWGVTDYLSFRWGDIWLPPGNIADIAIFLSAPVALVVIGFELQARMQRSLVTDDVIYAELAADRAGGDEAAFAARPSTGGDSR